MSSMEQYNLRKRLEKVTDKRRKAGQRHSTGNVLMIVFMAIMSGFNGYRAMGDFTIRYRQELLDYLNPNKDRLPSYSTIRRTLNAIDKTELFAILEEWTLNNFDKNGENWVSIDGKAIRGSINKDNKMIQLVSLFRQDSKEVLSAGDIDEKSNEIPLVRKLIEDFPFKEMIFTIDAMHTQYETVKTIKENGNDVVVQIKKTRKNCMKQL